MIGDHHGWTAGRTTLLVRAVSRGRDSRHAQVQTRSLTWPGVNGVEPEPIACLEAVRELERAAHAMQFGYVRKARGAGRSWYEIANALDLHWAASANKKSVVVEAYDYALELGRRSGLDCQPLTWTCLACEQTITDHGPYGDLPSSRKGMRRIARDGLPRFVTQMTIALLKDRREETCRDRCDSIPISRFFNRYLNGLRSIATR